MRFEKTMIAAGAAAFVLTSTTVAFAMLDPSRVYCERLGYEYVRAHTPKGVLGLCKLPGDRYVDANKFLKGLVALDHSWCAQQGLEPRYVDDPDVCRGCTACVMSDGTLVRVAHAMDLRTAEAECGDGICGTTESFGSCPADCASGLYDEFCDGLADGICDQDCADRSEADPDCDTTTDPPGSGGEDSGCGCRTSGAPRGSAIAVLSLLLLALKRRRDANGSPPRDSRRKGQ